MQPAAPRILIIDDDPSSSELLELMLQYSGTEYEVTTVHTPEAGLYLAATQRFDLFLLDYRLPGMNGAEVCRVIRRMKIDAPVMFFTGAAYEHDRWEAMQAGANAYLIKPDDLQQLTGTVKRLTGGSTAADMRGAPTTVHRQGAST
jgi:DNA-binding response OmpR family regulator